MPKVILTAVIRARIAALTAATIALHWAAREWRGDVADELRRLADEMAERARKLRGGY
jgi:hypothetical protein